MNSIYIKCNNFYSPKDSGGIFKKTRSQKDTLFICINLFTIPLSKGKHFLVN